MDTFISFATEKYRDAQIALEEEADKIGFAPILSYNMLDLTERGFAQKHKSKFDAMPSAGCVWKPYILSLVMENSNNGDFIYYSDCGDKLLPGILEYTKEVATNNHFSLVASNFVNWEWTKYDCFRLMKCDKPMYYSAMQLDAGQIGVINSRYTREIVKEWLACCEQDDLILDNTLTREIFTVKRHSRDQSILTNIAVKYGIATTPINEFIRYYTPNYRG
jgi:hypothetical protein